MFHVKRLLAVTAALLVLTACPLHYDDIGVHTDTVWGGQAQIDQGYIVDVPNLPGIWLAGHHSTHGAPFYNLTSAEVGDTLTYGGTRYVVTGAMVVDDWWTPRWIGTLVMQTSLSETTNLLVTAEPVG
jgi:hypothetical protein